MIVPREFYQGEIKRHMCMYIFADHLFTRAMLFCDLKICTDETLAILRPIKQTLIALISWQ